MFDRMKELLDIPLEKIALFRHVAPESLQGIIDCCGIRSLQRQETLLFPERVNRELYILLSGQLRIHLQDPQSEPIAYVAPGEVAGELSVIDGYPTSAYVIADEDSRVLVMEQELVWSLATVSHAAAFNLLTMLSGRLRNANRCIGEKMQQEHAYHSYGTVDALTGMHNRYWLDEALTRMVHRAGRSSSPLCVLMLDIDNFKEFNDAHGHLSGDRAIHTVAKTVLESLRPTVMAARYGGDEFLVAIPDVAVETALEIADRLRQKVAATEIPHQAATLPPLTVSIGVTGIVPGQSAEDVIAAADAALYRAKLLGRNTVSP